MIFSLTRQYSTLEHCSAISRKEDRIFLRMHNMRPIQYYYLLLQVISNIDRHGINKWRRIEVRMCPMCKRMVCSVWLSSTNVVVTLGIVLILFSYHHRSILQHTLNAGSCNKLWCRSTVFHCPGLPLNQQERVWQRRQNQRDVRKATIDTITQFQ